MYFTRILSRHNKIREFKFRWRKGQKQIIKPNTTKMELEKLGFTVIDAKEHYSPKTQTPQKKDVPPPLPELHRFENSFKPILGVGLDLLEKLTWTVTQPELPENVLKRKRELVPADASLLHEHILSAHVFDCWQEKIKDDSNFELPNKLERYDYYGIPHARKNQLLLNHVLHMFSATGLDPLTYLSRIADNQVEFSSIFNYKDVPVHVGLTGALVNFGAETMPLSVDPKETELFVAPKVDEKTRRLIQRKLIAAEEGGPLQRPIPEVEALDPFIGGKILDRYPSVETNYQLYQEPWIPHTLYLFPNCTKKLHHHQVVAQMLQASHAFALSDLCQREVEIDQNGTLAKPFALQCVHWDNNTVVAGVFQFNTLGPFIEPVHQIRVSDNNEVEKILYPHLKHILPHSKRDNEQIRNVFFYSEPMKMFDTACYVNAKPTLTGFDSETFSVLRAIHEI